MTALADKKAAKKATKKAAKKIRGILAGDLGAPVRTRGASVEVKVEGLEVAVSATIMAPAEVADEDRVAAFVAGLAVGRFEVLWGEEGG